MRSSRARPAHEVAGAAGLNLGLLSTFIGYHLRVAQVAAFREFEARLTSFGTAPRYLGLLMLVKENPGAAQSRIAEAIHLDRSSLVPIIDKLEQEGLVERRAADGDRRLKSLWLTRKGEQTLSNLTPLVMRHEALLAAGFTAKEREQLLDMLVRLSRNCGGTSGPPVGGVSDRHGERTASDGRIE